MQLLVKMWSALCSVFAFVLGRWSPPWWLTRLGTKIRALASKLGHRLKQLRLQRPRLFWSVSGITSVIIAALVAGGYWWLTLPEPNWIKFTVVPPKPQTFRYESKPNPVVIDFSSPASKLELIGKPIDAGVILNPPMPGTWTFESDSKLMFTPEKEWEVDQSYTVDMNKRLFASGVKLKNYEATFKTEAFKIQQIQKQFYQDPIEESKRLVQFDVEFSHPVDRKLFEDAITIERPSKRTDGSENADGQSEYKFKVDYKHGDTSAIVQSEYLKLPERKLELKFKLSSGVRAATGGNKHDSREEIVVVPSADSLLSVSALSASYLKNEDLGALYPILTFEFTTNVKTSSLLKSVEAYLLPIDRPVFPSDPRDQDPNSDSSIEARKNYNWSNPNEITDEILKSSPEFKKIGLTQSPGSTDDPLPVIGLVHQAGEKRKIFVRVKRGLVAFGGYKLADTYAQVVQIPEIRSELNFLSKGSILSLVGEKKLTLASRGVKGIRTTFFRIDPARINHFVRHNLQSQFQRPEFYGYFNEDDISERFEDNHVVEAADPTKSSFYSIDVARFLESGSPSRRKGLFAVAASKFNPEDLAQQKRLESLQNNSGSNRYPSDVDLPSFHSADDKRLLLVTDLAFMVKKNRDGSFRVMVLEVKSGRAAVGATVNLVGRNGLNVATKTTDANGAVDFESSEGFRSDREPVAWVVTKGDDLSFMPFNQYSRSLSFSNFDIGGDSSEPSKIEGYLFSDRGLYRPGEEIFLGSILKGSAIGSFPSDLPLELVLVNPRGAEVLTRKIQVNSSGIDEYKIATKASDVTGTYSILIRLRNSKDAFEATTIASTTIKVEEFLPDRLKYELDLVTEPDAPKQMTLALGWKKPTSLSVRSKVELLFGGPAAGNKVDYVYDLIPQEPTISGYEGYEFKFSQQGAKYINDESLGEFQTNDQGKVYEPLGDLSLGNAFYRVTVTGHAFEKAGGRNVARMASAMVADRDFILGTKPDKPLSWIRKGDARSINLIAVGPDLKLVKTEALDVKVVELKYVSALMKGGDGLYTYQSKEVEELIQTKQIALNAATESFVIPTNKVGKFVIRIEDADRSLLAERHYSVSGTAELKRGMARNSELQVKPNKTEFVPGDVAEFEIKAPFVGSGFITIESDRVMHTTWFKADTETSVQRVSIPSDFSGSGYVNIVLVRSSKSPEIYTSPLSYSVFPIKQVRTSVESALKLSFEETTNPKDKIAVNIESERSTRLVLYAVDQGILQVARYQTPDPLSYFLRKRSLGVSTFQIFDQIMPESSLAIRAATGGDGDSGVNRNLNPFRRKTLPPAVYWSGVIDVPKGNSSHEVTLPSHFNGGFKIFAVGLADGRVAVTSAEGKRVGPFVISPVLPLFVAPGDKFKANVSVSNQLKGSGKEFPVEVVVKTSGLFSPPKPQTIKINEGQEALATFEFETGEQLGEVKIDFLAQRAGTTQDQVSFQESVSIRPSSVRESTKESFVLSNGSKEINLSRVFHPELYSGSIAISPLPIGFMKGLWEYVKDYPHGCTEQLVSQAMAAMAALEVQGVFKDRTQAATFIEDVKSQLRSRQSSDGNIGYWTSSSRTYKGQSIYVAHMFQELVDRGLASEDGFLRSLRSWVSEYVKSESKEGNKQNALLVSYGVYVLARANLIDNQLLLQVRDGFERDFKGDKSIKDWKRSSLGLFLAAAMKIKGLEKEAKEMISRVSVESIKESADKLSFDLYFSQELAISQATYIFVKHFFEQSASYQAEIAKQAATSEQQNTLRSGWQILALSEVAKKFEVSSMSNWSVSAKTKSESNNQSELRFEGEGYIKSAQLPAESKIVTLTNPGQLPLYASFSQAGFDKKETLKPAKKGVDVTREFYVEGKKVSSVKVGQEIDVLLTVRGERASVYNVAVVDLFPGGTEYDLSRVYESSEEVESNSDGSDSDGQEFEEDSDATDDASEESESEEGASIKPKDFSNPWAWINRSLDWVIKGDFAFADSSQPLSKLPLMNVDFVEPREDRIFVYGDLTENATVFQYKLRATVPGDYVVPAPYVHSMYQLGTYARGDFDKLRVLPVD